MLNRTIFKPMLISLALIAGPALAETPPSMTIQSTGTVSAEPDMARISFAMHATAPEAQEAMRGIAGGMQRAFATMQTAGITLADISTTGLSLQPRYRNDLPRTQAVAPEIVGYQAHNRVTVTVRDLAKLGEVLDALVQGGVNGIDGVSFGISDSSALEVEARAKAAREARAKAEAYAAAIGTEITGIVSMQEINMGRGPMPYGRMEMAMASDTAVPVAGGEMDVSATLSVVFSLSGTLEAAAE